MERLTARNPYNEAYSYGACQKIKCDYDCNSCVMNKLIERLCEIEDILGPTYDLSRLKELVDADREGMVPKYKIGDIVHDIFDLAWEVVSAECHTTETGRHEWLYRLGHNGTPDYSAMYEREILANEAAEKAMEEI